ncbi:hypothetical protein RND81_13G139800 [Saponaria officinalis]|uniref:Uncharacterized protein n=1 Tax=Saponaria officinalis TaxID=3572 RepID=A0AAW1H0G3_SAPOF
MSSLQISNNTKSSLLVMHKLRENMNIINQVRSSNREIKETTHQTSIRFRIRKQWSSRSTQLMMLVHRGSQWFASQVPHIRKNIEDIFTLTQKNTLRIASNYNA